MSKLTKLILTLLLMTAVLGYTVYNFVIGQTEQVSFLVYMVILGIPFVNMINLLIQELKER